MKRPGDRLRALAAWLCTPRSVERFIDPAVADLQYEHAGALRSGSPWRARWIVAAGMCRLVQVLAVQIVSGSQCDDSREGASAFGAATVAAFVTLGLTTLLTALMLSHIANLLTSAHEWLALSTPLVPAAMPVALPVGVGLGVFVLAQGSAGRPTTAHVLGVALVCALAMFVMVGWITPTTNDWFRREAAYAYGISPSRLQRGTAEMTVAELWRGVPKDLRIGGEGLYRAAVQLHSRFAIPFSPAVFALLSLTLQRRRLVWPTAFFALAACGFLAIYVVSPPLLRAFDTTPALLVAWLPNAAVLLMTLVAWTTAAPSRPGRDLSRS